MTPLAYVGAREAAPIASWAMQTADIFAYLEAMRNQTQTLVADDGCDRVAFLKLG